MPISPRPTYLLEQTLETDKRLIFIGDIHGCFTELEQLLDKVTFHPERDIVISVGDLVDRGPFTNKVLKFLLSDINSFKMCLGNHEEKHIRYWWKETHGLENKMKTSPVFLTEHQKVLPFCKQLLSFPVKLDINYIDERKFTAIHAGFTADRPLDQQHYSQIMRTRNLDHRGAMIPLYDMQKGEKGEFYNSTGVHWTDMYHGDRDIMYGHIVTENEQVRIDKRPNAVCYGLDGGAVFGGQLNALVIEPGKEPVIASVEAKKTYFGKRESPLEA